MHPALTCIALQLPSYNYELIILRLITPRYGRVARLRIMLEDKWVGGTFAPETRRAATGSS